MEENKIVIDIPSLRDLATAFGLLVHALEQEDIKAMPRQLHEKNVYILYAVIFILPKKLDDASWQEAVSMAMEALLSRRFRKNDGSIFPFPEWDPDEKDSLDCYALCDAFLCADAVNEAFASARAPEDYLGPLFSNAGHILDGVKRGYHVEGEAIKEIEKDYISRVYGQFQNPVQGSALLQRQFDALEAMIHQASETKNEG